MNTTIPKAYDPTQVEDRWYARWLDQGFFHAKVYSHKPAYSIVIPPPNVTGVLTMGHVLNNTLQDILARRARMLGKEVLWLPGTDHAGIATQTVVERELRKEKKNRRDLGREKFLARVWEWKEKHGGIIIQQLKKLGCSCDWARQRFTMDENYDRWVTEIFVRLYRKGLIYRGKRMVNWCPKSLTALSDEEVITKMTSGFLYHMKYEIADDDARGKTDLDSRGKTAKRKYLEIATTRPETLMGDTAVAVNPDDKRYKKYIGKHCWRPFPREKIPIIADEHIDPAFGTGVLKVTPAHDKADFEIGQRHKLPVIDIFNPDATLNELAGPEFKGLDRFDARKVAVEKLKELGLLVREEPYQNNVGYSERADVPIEPRLSEQWFLRYPKTKETLEAVLKDEVHFHPERWKKTFEHWMTNLQDWCISRQLWWGHRIPAWYHRENGQIHVGMHPPGWSEFQAGDDKNWVQDPDVLDTWFSSWLWPFATMDAEVRKKFYPTTDLVTGPDIIFFWVARMIMAGFEFMEEKPFSNVYFTGIIRDKRGVKMQKSLGNSPDPLDLINRYGADGLRFGVIRIAPQGQDIHFDEQEIEQGRNFCNKLWNACRFRQMQNPAPKLRLEELKAGDLASDEKAILWRLNRAILEINILYSRYEFSQIAQKLYDLFWGCYCDWFMEASKASLLSDDERRRSVCLAVMDHCLSVILRLLHPYVPFITEELWQSMGYAGADSQASVDARSTIMLAPWPEPLEERLNPELGLTEDMVNFVEAKYALITAGRNLKAEYKIPPNKKVRFVLKPEIERALVEEELSSIKILLNAESIELAADGKLGTPATITPFATIHMPLEGLVDTEMERKRLQGKVAKIEKDLQAVAAKLANPNFATKAPPAVVEETKANQKSLAEELAKIQEQLKAL